MSLDRLVVRIAAPLMMLSGIVCVFLPDFIAGAAGIRATPAGVVALRAIYGGFQLGLGGFLWWCAADSERTVAGLVALGFVCADLATIRLLSMIVGGEYTAFLMANLAFEIGTAARAATAFVRRPRAITATA